MESERNTKKVKELESTNITKNDESTQTIVELGSHYTEMLDLPDTEKIEKEVTKVSRVFFNKNNFLNFRIIWNSKINIR